MGLANRLFFWAVNPLNYKSHKKDKLVRHLIILFENHVDWIFCSEEDTSQQKRYIEKYSIVIFGDL